MIILASTSDRIQVVTSAALATDVQSSYVDWDGTVATPGRLNTAITTATTTDVVGGPGASVQRNVKALSVRNKSVSSQTVIVRHTDGTTIVELFRALLATNECLQFAEGDGFSAYNSSGARKTIQGSDWITCVRLAGDQSNATTTPTSVTGLLLPTTAGVFQFKYYILYQSAATTTGVRFSVNHTGTLTSFVANMRWVDASATASTAAATQAGVGAAGQVTGAMSARLKSTAGWGTTISVDALNSDMLMIIEGLFVCTVAGNLELYHGSEVAATSTVKAGSNLLLVQAV